jgi:hypothetical protein
MKREKPTSPFNLAEFSIQCFLVALRECLLERKNLAADLARMGMLTISYTFQ